MRQIEWANGRKVITETPMPSVSRFQARMALRRAGMFAAAEAACTAAGGDALLAWDEAIEWRRDSPMVASIAAALDLTAAQLDALFSAAAAFQV